MKIFKYQGWHLIFLFILVFLLDKMIFRKSVYMGGFYLGKSAYFWLKCAVAAPILHQIYVWICWRLELHYKSLTKTFGRNAFKIYRIIFMILFISRLVFLIFLAEASSSYFSLGYKEQYILIAFCLILSGWTFYSVARYFGFKRAAGLDHFDEAVSKMPFVKKGIFKYTRNAMYTFGFLVLYAVAIWYNSEAALWVAAFNHAYIWVHYYCTELPDMRMIYGRR